MAINLESIKYSNYFRYYSFTNYNETFLDYYININKKELSTVFVSQLIKECMFDKYFDINIGNKDNSCSITTCVIDRNGNINKISFSNENTNINLPSKLIDYTSLDSLNNIILNYLKNMINKQFNIYIHLLLEKNNTICLKGINPATKQLMVNLNKFINNYNELHNFYSYHSLNKVILVESKKNITNNNQNNEEIIRRMF